MSSLIGEREGEIRRFCVLSANSCKLNKKRKKQQLPKCVEAKIKPSREPDIIHQKFDLSKIDIFWVNMPVYSQQREEIGLVWASGHIFGVKYAHTLVIFLKPVTSSN